MLETIFRVIGKISRTITNRTILYLENSSIHGFRYIVDKETFFFERILWLVMCSLSMYGTYVLFQSTLDSYQGNPISIATETTYLDWNTPFPAIYACEGKHYPKIDAFAKMLLKEEYEYKYTQWFADYLFYDGTCGYCDTFCYQRNVTCDFKGIENHVQRFWFKCEKFITDCTWNDQPFNCCDFFEPIQTEFGRCFVINSMHNPSYLNTSMEQRKLHFYSNISTGPGTMKFSLLSYGSTHVRSPEETLFLAQNEENEWNKYLVSPSDQLITFKATEIINDPQLAEIPINVRGCIFQRENPSEMFSTYGYSTCIVECHMHAAVKECGCVPHIFPWIHPLKPEWNYTICDILGLHCVYRRSDSIYEEKTHNVKEMGLDCNCLPYCNEIEFSVPLNHVKLLDYTNLSLRTVVTISMDSLSTERFVRNIVRTKLDLVVSMGGAAGLFLGASLLSVIEIIYFCCLYRNRSPEEIWYKSQEKSILQKGKPTKLNKDKIPQIGNKAGLQESSFRQPFVVTPPGYYPKEFPTLPKELEF